MRRPLQLSGLGLSALLCTATSGNDDPTPYATSVTVEGPTLALAATAPAAGAHVTGTATSVPTADLVVYRLVVVATVNTPGQLRMTLETDEQTASYDHEFTPGADGGPYTRTFTVTGELSCAGSCDVPGFTLRAERLDEELLGVTSITTTITLSLESESQLVERAGLDVQYTLD
jgi:hypothetical protein